MPKFLDVSNKAAARAAIDFDVAAYDVAVEALSQTEAVAEAAVAAVEDAADGLDLVLASDPRLPEARDADIFRVCDITGATALKVTEDGETVIGGTEFRAAGDLYSGLRIMDSANSLAMEVRPDGTVFVGQFATDSASFAAVETSKVHVMIAMGQSNMSGRGEPTDAELDPDDSRIWQYGSGANAITQATVPLDMADVPAGLSPITVIAREYLKRLPPGEVVLIVPAAKGASVLGAVDTEAVNGVWSVNYVGASLDLYGLAVSQIDAAIAAAGEKWSTAEVVVTGMFWHQGEGNASTSTADYKTRFDAIVSDLRSHLSDADMPVVLGGMSPEWVAANPSLDNIVAAHIDTPSRVVRTGFAPGPVDACARAGNQVHYHRTGVIELGKRMLAAWDRALLNETGLEQHAPMRVSAELVSGTLTVEWDLPPCRYTGFTVEYDDGGGWTAITHTDVSTTATTTGVTAPVQVRVATVNEEGTSYTSTPVYADYKG